MPRSSSSLVTRARKVWRCTSICLWNPWPAPTSKPSARWRFERHMENAAVYQLKIVLQGIKPPVWRRVLVPKDCTISLLHETVQIAMGWWNCHLHRFLIRGKEYGVTYEGGVS